MCHLAWNPGEVNLLDKLASYHQEFGNFSLSYDETNCSILEVGQYATLSVPSAEVFGEKFPVSSLADGKWHQVALSISLERLALYVDCQLVESVGWSSYIGMGVTTEGLLVIGGLIESFEIPFEGALRQLTFLMGDAGAASEHCQTHNSTCSSPLGKEAKHNMTPFWALFPQTGTQVLNETNEIQESDVQVGLSQPTWG
uniref:Uncharacterized protein n=1 Tax=Sphaerodactylus townsendi TaxID=933632 RepID=A0ACB8EZK4_9SAUR